MNDKFKGLVLGLSIGVLMTGSIAYASGTQIEVYFKNIKYMFDGQQKKPADDSFIYNGTTYVPLRFVSEALGKEVTWDGDNDTIYVGRKIDLSSTVGVYKGGQVTLGELEKYINIIRLINQQDASSPADVNAQTSALKQLIAGKILTSRLTNEDKEALPNAVAKQFKNIKSYIQEISGGQDSKAFLATYNLVEEDLHTYLEEMVGTQKALGASAKATYDQEVKNNNTDYLAASVSHILISFKNDQGVERTAEEVDKKVKEVQTKLQIAGSDFAAVAREYSEDPGSKAQGGLYENAAVSDWVPEFKKATIELPLKTISEPVETQFGYHIIRVETRGYNPYLQAPDSIVRNLVNKAYKQFSDNELPGLIEKIELPK
ncbi:peptidylprolyl isomerase [Paenibacillus sp. LMG 31456]|uniref:Peptidylprolyl isomerase n=1 Tax=Paenibacillus foliorum TaxID=2654974 RepID=A0A972GUG5_9BACL|nr:peptidylprolyl isomerase [Paenibacillus foliorum]NOU97061.1 peptidylprolyl isomerase [Paenibacillus foliorum]